MDEMMKEDPVSRREFLKRTAAGAAAISLAGLAPTAANSAGESPQIPHRALGQTGLKVSMLGFGGGSRFLTARPEDAEAMLERAIKSGITYFDTAASYGKERKSEKIYGRVLPRHRKSIVLATKDNVRTYDGMMRSVEESLKALQTDYLDLMQMHDVGPKDDPKAWEKPDGALTALRQLRDQKVIRFIGFTGHQNAETHKSVIEQLNFDTVLMALNAAGHKAFHEKALPAAEKKKMGIIAMKVTRGLVGTGQGKASPKELLSWAFGLPISTVIVGMETVEQIDENIALARSFRPGTADVAALTGRLAPHVTDEQVGWAVPGYMDA